MLLQQRNGSDQQIVTSTDQINIQQTVISDQTVNSFIVSYSISRSELNNYFYVWVSGDCTFGIVELEYVSAVSEKFVLCVELGIIGDRQYFSAGII